jgi:hypothetical protein
MHLTGTPVVHRARRRHMLQQMPDRNNPMGKGGGAGGIVLQHKLRHTVGEYLSTRYCDVTGEPTVDLDQCAALESTLTAILVGATRSIPAPPQRMRQHDRELEAASPRVPAGDRASCLLWRRGQ